MPLAAIAPFLSALWASFWLAAPPGEAEVRIRIHPGEVLNRITPYMTGSCIEDV